MDHLHIVTSYWLTAVDDARGTDSVPRGERSEDAYYREAGEPRPCLPWLAAVAALLIVGFVFGSTGG